MNLEPILDKEKNDSLINTNIEKTKEIKINEDQVLKHKEMLKKIKNPIWNKFNY